MTKARAAKRKKAQPHRMLRALDERAYQQHLKALDALPGESKPILETLFEDAKKLMYARHESFTYAGNIGLKAVYDHANAAFRESCEAYHRQCASDAQDGRSPTREWLARLRVIMGSEWTKFADIDAMVEETRPTLASDDAR